MRTRQRGNIYEATCDHSLVGWDGFPPPNPTPITLSYTRDSRESFSDLVTPGYYQKVKKGELLPVNPMSSSKVELLLDEVNVSYNYRIPHPYKTGGRTIGRKGGAYGCYPGEPGFRGDLSEVDTNALLIEALAKARTDAWDLLTFAAEFHKTRDLVRGAGERFEWRQNKILDLIKKRRRSRTPTYRELSKEFSDMWLEYRYGWRIVAYDISSAHAAIESLKSKARTIIRSTAVESDTDDSVAQTNGLVSFLGVLDGRVHYNAQRTVRAGVGVEVLLDTPVNADLLVTAHELTPWSFVLDWFFNVGENFAAFSPFAAGSVKWGWYSIEDTYTTEAEVSSQRYFDEAGLSGGGTPWHTCYLAKKTVKTRVPQTPSFDISFRPNLNLAKGVDLVALATGIVVRKKRALARIAGGRY